MDWHFRQNRRIKNQSKQTLCRGWQDISEDDWIESKTVEGKFTSRFFFFFFFFFFLLLKIKSKKKNIKKNFFFFFFFKCKNNL